MSGSDYKAVWLSNDMKLYQKSDSDNKDEIYEPEGNGNFKTIDLSKNNSDVKTTIKNEVLKFLDNKYDHIVVLIGAGASVTDNILTKDKDKNGIAIAGVTVAKIAEEVAEQLRHEEYCLKGESVDVFKLDDIAKKINYSDDIFYGDKLKDNFNLEECLSNIFTYEEFINDEDKEKQKFINTKKAILDIIVNATSYNYDSKLFNHAKFLNILSKRTNTESKLNLVTTNYDTLIEDAAESMKWTVFDGFSFSQNPQFDSTMFDWNLVKEVPNVKTNENIYKPNVVNLLKIHGSITWERSKSGNNISRKSKTLIADPLMVFPSTNKYAQSYQEPYFDLFNKFQNLLHKPNTLLITTGFSFSDNHIARMIISAIQTNDGLSTLITDFNIEPQNKNWEELTQAMDNYYNVAFLKATLNGELSDYLGGSMNDN